MEISPAFIHEWEAKPDKAYALPGGVAIKEFLDSSDAHVRAAPPGSGDVGQRVRRRVVLKDVPVAQLKATLGHKHARHEGQTNAALDISSRVVVSQPSYKSFVLNQNEDIFLYLSLRHQDV